MVDDLRRTGEIRIFLSRGRMESSSGLLRLGGVRAVKAGWSELSEMMSWRMFIGGLV